MKKLVIAGGSGFLGKLLTDHFINKEFEVVVLSRNHQVNRENLRFVKWDAENPGNWKSELENAEALINLNGKSVDCRYSEENMQAIYDTRINATRVLAEAIQQCQYPPKVWLNASSATIYRHAEDRLMDEESGDLGEGFSVDVCKKWEETLFASEAIQLRKIALRIAIVLGKNGGAVQPLKRLARFGLGGKQGSGQQYFSWIHEEDFVEIVDWLISHENASGVYNLSAPNPVPNQQFMKALRSELKVPFGLPAPKWLLEIGAWLIRTETELILKSRRVFPGRLISEGYKFRYEHISDAFKSILS